MLNQLIFYHSPRLNRHALGPHNLKIPVLQYILCNVSVYTYILYYEHINVSTYEYILYSFNEFSFTYSEIQVGCEKTLSVKTEKFIVAESYANIQTTMLYKKIQQIITVQ